MRPLAAFAHRPRKDWQAKDDAIAATPVRAPWRGSPAASNPLCCPRHGRFIADYLRGPN